MSDNQPTEETYEEWYARRMAEIDKVRAKKAEQSKELDDEYKKAHALRDTAYQNAWSKFETDLAAITKTRQLALDRAEQTFDRKLGEIGEKRRLTQETLDAEWASFGKEAKERYGVDFDALVAQAKGEV